MKLTSTSFRNGISHTIFGRTLADSQPLQEYVDREIAQPRCIHTVSGIRPIYKVWERRVEELGNIGVVDCESADFGVNAAHRGLDLLVETRTGQNQIYGGYLINNRTRREEGKNRLTPVSSPACLVCVTHGPEKRISAS